jgi:hypothetical protein
VEAEFRVDVTDRDRRRVTKKLIVAFYNLANSSKNDSNIVQHNILSIKQPFFNFIGALFYDTAKYFGL